MANLEKVLAVLQSEFWDQLEWSSAVCWLCYSLSSETNWSDQVQFALPTFPSTETQKLQI
jgi:hypothetical protein